MRFLKIDWSYKLWMGLIGLKSEVLVLFLRVKVIEAKLSSPPPTHKPFYIMKRHKMSLNVCKLSAKAMEA